MGKDKDSGIKVLVRNRKARFHYEIIETLEAGIVLTGTEIKSLRQCKAHVEEAYARILNGELVILGMHISPFEPGNRYNVDPLRTRKLLLHRRQIDRLVGRIKREGLTIVPLSIYLRRGWAKMEIAVARGKKRHDKRAVLAERDAKRSMDRARKLAHRI
ncbi:SsrA-binding protein SmpB [Pasteuria penetrans]|uniref:SsrA-binding protein SmpB n=1 Tax=Pasteuria penetrans TaxID=86005 RepID=UPI000F97E632|nr:SsrA-binding protein SmpB [Pasteuria penetrans]